MGESTGRKSKAKSHQRSATSPDRRQSESFVKNAGTNPQDGADREYNSGSNSVYCRIAQTVVYGVGVAGGVFDSSPGLCSAGLVAVSVGESCRSKGWPTEVMAMGVGGRVASDGTVCRIPGPSSWMLGKRPAPPQSMDAPDCLSARKPAAPPHEMTLTMMPMRITHVKKRRSRSAWGSGGLFCRSSPGDVLLARIGDFTVHRLTVSIHINR